MRPVGLVILLAHLSAGIASADPRLDLLTAARHGDLAAIRAALDAGAPVDAADPDFAQTALVRAAMFRQRAATEALLAAKADPRKTSNLDRTALHWAAAAGAADIVPLLVRAGAAVDAGDAYDETPLGYAADAGQPDAVKALLAAGAAPEKLQRPLARRLALVIGNGVSGRPLDALLAIVATRRALEVPDEIDGRTPLLVAAEYAHRDGGPVAAAALVRAGANRGAKDNAGKTARQIVEDRLATEKEPAAIVNLRATLAVLR